MKTSTVLLASLLCLSMLACRPHPGGGQAGKGHGLRRDCSAEIEQFCAADQKGRDRRECLQNHLSQLSDTCKAALSARGHHGGREKRNRFRP